MSAPHSLAHGTSVALLWFGRILGFLLVLLILALWAEDGGPVRPGMTGHETVLAACLAGAAAGMLLGWHWTRTGGVVNVVAVVFFLSVEWAVTGGAPRAVWVVFLAVPGVLYLASALVVREPEARPA